MKKRILSIAAALIMLLSCLPAAGAAGIYTDVGDPAVLEAALMLNRLGAIQPAEKLNPDETLTRAMFCAIAVMLSGRITDVEQYRYYTVFPDVRANHWALGYINAAVRELKLLGPRPDGTFGPDHAILFEEAVTIMVRMLGYGDEDLGYNWPRNYLNKAAALGLTAGVGQTRTLTRAQGILLFYNMLYISVNGESGDYIETALGVRVMSGVTVDRVLNTAGRRGLTLSNGFFCRSDEPLDEKLEGKKIDVTVDRRDFIIKLEELPQEYETVKIKNVVVLKSDAADDDGVYGLLIDDGTGFYPLKTDVNEDFTYRRVDLELDGNGFVISIAALRQTSRSVTAALTGVLGITDASGATTPVPSSAKVYINGISAPYSSVYADISRGDEITVYFRGGGAVDYLVWDKNYGDGPEVLVATALQAGAEGLETALGVEAGGLTIIKNGVRTIADSIQPYDTLRFSGKTVNVSSLRLPVTFRGGTVRELTVGGLKLSFTPAATLQAEKFGYGERVILCVATDGTVGAVFGDITPNAAGYMKDGGTVELVNGLSMSGTPGSGIFSGMPVSVSANTGGALQISRLAFRDGGAYNVAAGTVGSRAVSPWCKYYTMSGEMVYPIDKSELPNGVITAGRVRHYYIGDGGIEMMIIQNVNGDALTYGFCEYKPAEFSGLMVVGSDENAGVVLTGFGQTTEKITVAFQAANDSPRMDGAFVAVELATSYGELRVTDIKRCLSYRINPEELFSDGYIMINGTKTPISDECMENGAYFRRDNKYVGIADIRDIVSAGSVLTVWCDEAPSLGGKVRMIEIG